MLAILSHWGLLGIGIMYLLGGMAVPWPIELPLGLSGQMLHQGVAGYWDLVLVTWAGMSGGNMIAFAVARWGGRPLLLTLSHRLHVQEQVQRMQVWIDRYGLGMVLLTRWINWGFGLSLWMVGFSELPPVRSVAVMLINNLVWSCAWVALGRVLMKVLFQAGLPDWLVLAPGALMLVVLGTWRLWQRARVQKRNG